MIFLVNPRKGRRMARKKARTAAQRRATAKLVAFNKRRRKKSARRRVVKRKATRRKRVATKRQPVRRKTTVRRRATRRKPVRRKKTVRRRSTSRKVRRNPPARFSAKGILGEVQQGAIDAAGVVVGKAATRIVANFIPVPKDTALMNFVVQAGSAIGVGMLARMVVSRDMARMVIAGGFAAPIESFAKGIPFIGPMLGDDYLELGEYAMGEHAMGDADPFLPIGDADPFLPIGEDFDDPYVDMGEYATEGYVGEYAFG